MESEMHCCFLSAGELRGIVGDDTDHGAGRNEHSGIWFLTSIQNGQTTVARGKGILILGHHRRTGPKIRKLEHGGVELFKEASEANNFVETRGIYRLTAPYYVDYELTGIARAGHKASRYHSFSWCSYMNSPKEGGIHFIENGRFIYYYNPVHGQAATLFPTRLPVEERELYGQKPITTFLTGERNFAQSDSGHTFDYPFYFGRIHGLMFLIMADRYKSLRFYISPSGGGQSLIPGATNPAWDLHWTTGEMKVNEEKKIHIRIAYKRPTVKNHYLADDAWQEYQKFIQGWPCQDE